MRIRKASIVLSGAAAALLATMGTASATVTFDPSTGAGFVGKGDVQIPFGWNNATLQTQAPNVSFSYVKDSTVTYDVVCEWDTGTRNIQHHTVTQDTTGTTSVKDSVAYSVRQNPKSAVTGFNLTGFGSTSSVTSGDVPLVGDTTWCNANEIGPQGTPVTSVTELSSSTDETLTASDSAVGKGPAVIWANGVSVQP